MKTAIMLLAFVHAFLISETESAPSGNSINANVPNIDCPEAEVAVSIAHKYIALHRNFSGSDEKIDTVNVIGYDIYKDEDVKRLVCKIIKVKSVKEWSEVINTPYSFVKLRYQGMIRHFARHGGVQGLILKTNIGQDVSRAAIRHGFPNFPLKHSADIVPFLRTMVIRYGQGFLGTLSKQMNVTVKDPDYVGRVIAKASSLKEIQNGLDRDWKTTESIYSTIRGIVNYFKIQGALIADMTKLLQMFEARGLLILD